MKKTDLEKRIEELETKVTKLESVKYPTTIPAVVWPMFPGYPAWPYPYNPYPNYYVTTSTTGGQAWSGQSQCCKTGGMVSGGTVGKGDVKCQ
jgi:hypothetical protein